MNRNDKGFHYVYITTNKINGKKYIGQHSTNNINDGYLGSGKKLLHDFKKYGKENFSKKILKEVNSADNLDFLETNYIKEYNTLYPNGYNLTTGGESKKEYSKESLRKMSEKAKKRGPMNKETKTKIGEASKGRVFTEESRKKKSVSLKGRIFTEEHKRKLSEAHKGMKKPWVKGNLNGPWNPNGGPGRIGGLFAEKNGMYGKHHTEESKKKMGEKISEKLKGRVFADEHKRNLSKSKLGKGTFPKGVGHKQRFINIYGENEGLKKFNQFQIKQSMAKQGKGIGKIPWNKNKKLTDEHKRKIKESLKNKHRNLKLIKCPYCGLNGRGGNMTRYHFEKCKSKW